MKYVMVRQLFVVLDFISILALFCLYATIIVKIHLEMPLLVFMCMLLIMYNFETVVFFIEQKNVVDVFGR